MAETVKSGKRLMVEEVAHAARLRAVLREIVWGKRIEDYRAGGEHADALCAARLAGLARDGLEASYT